MILHGSRAGFPVVTDTGCCLSAARRRPTLGSDGAAIRHNRLHAMQFLTVLSRVRRERPALGLFASSRSSPFRLGGSLCHWRVLVRGLRRRRRVMNSHAIVAVANSKSITAATLNHPLAL
jgi:hypothetical protein